MADMVVEPTIAYLYAKIIDRIGGIIDGEYSKSKDATSFVIPIYMLVSLGNTIMNPLLSEAERERIVEIRKGMPALPSPTEKQEMEVIEFFDFLMGWQDILQLSATNNEIIIKGENPYIDKEFLNASSKRNRKLSSG